MITRLSSETVKAMPQMSRAPSEGNTAVSTAGSRTQKEALEDERL